MLCWLIRQYRKFPVMSAYSYNIRLSNLLGRILYLKLIEYSWTPLYPIVINLPLSHVTGFALSYAVPSTGRNRFTFSILRCQSSRYLSVSFSLMKESLKKNRLTHNAFIGYFFLLCQT